MLAGAGLLAGGLAAGTSFAGEESEIAGQEFSDRSIKGWWGFHTEVGWLVPPTVPALTPTAAVGRVYFDGKGGCEVHNTLNVNGVSNSFVSSSCSYSVNPDGTGTSESVTPGLPISDPVPIAFVIADRGRELRLMTTKFMVGTFSARRQ